MIRPKSRRRNTTGRLIMLLRSFNMMCNIFFFLSLLYGEGDSGESIYLCVMICGFTSKATFAIFVHGIADRRSYYHI